MVRIFARVTKFVELTDEQFDLLVKASTTYDEKIFSSVSDILGSAFKAGGYVPGDWIEEEYYRRNPDGDSELRFSDVDFEW